MRTLAKTLLVLGSIGGPACERIDGGTPAPRPPAEPLVDRAGRPAIGNIGQAGRPDPIVALPVVTPPPPAPAVAPPVVQPQRPRVRTVERRRAPARVVEAVKPAEVALPVPSPEPPAPQQLSGSIERPLLDREARPATGNVKGRKAGPSYEERLERAKLREEQARRAEAEDPQ